MVFSSLQFIFLFLPIVILGYYLLDRRYKNIFLLLVSVAFYAWGEPEFVSVMVAMCLANWIIGLLIYMCNNIIVRRLLVILGIVIDIGSLFVYKYLNFVTANLSIFVEVRVTDIVLPIGISFFTFQMLSYLLDVYKTPRELVCKNPIDLILYMIFFPQLIAGPIVRYNSIIEQIRKRTESIELIGKGFERFIIGLSKKVLIANNMAVIADRAFSLQPEGLSAGFAWLGAIAYTFQIYFDFSGYSDMAIGLGRMFGFEFEENFNYPYIARSITDFWRRWHISLSKWFKDYVYVPLGGDGRNCRKPTAAHIRNLTIVWLFTGIWHGAQWTFVIWGVGYLFLLLVEGYLIRPDKRGKLFQAFYRVFVMFAVVLLWVVFRANNVTVMTQAMLCNLRVLADNNFSFYFKEYFWFFAAAVIASVPVKPWLENSKILDSKSFQKSVWILKTVSMLLIFVYDISYLVLGHHNPFIYFNF